MLCLVFPNDGSTSFQQLAVLRAGRRRFSFHPRKGQAAFGINRMQLLGILAFDAPYISLGKARQFLVALIAYPSLAFARQIMILPPGLPGTKPDPVAIGLLNGNHLALGKRCNTESINDMRLGDRKSTRLNSSHT